MFVKVDKSKDGFEAFEVVFNSFIDFSLLEKFFVLFGIFLNVCGDLFNVS
jgi:hypothetical protein